MSGFQGAAGEEAQHDGPEEGGLDRVRRGADRRGARDVRAGGSREDTLFRVVEMIKSANFRLKQSVEVQAKKLYLLLCLISSLLDAHEKFP